MRSERDKIGEILLEDEKLHGIQTARAMDNFKLEHKKTSLQLIYALVTIKKAAAMTYQKLGVGKDGVYAGISQVCDMILQGKLDDAFVTEALQGGAGTSTNMNVNEVIANLTLLKLGFKTGSYDIVHPLDDVNRGQSTNDVYPTALRIAAIQMLRKLSEACAQLQQALQTKENEFDSIIKLGRTELMDAVPITLGQEFGSYAQAVARDRWRLYKVEERLRQVNIGGTAVGIGNNAERKYRFGVIEVLRELTGIGLATAEYPMDITQNNDVFVEVSGLLKALAVNLMKISNDLRLMNSGPRGGLSEITLAPLQMGSTIMPGKVNPVIPEMVMQVSMRVMANDVAISTAAAHGEFELNAFMPLIADSLLESLGLLINAAELFRTKCIELIKPNAERCKDLLELSYAFTAAYTPFLGYDKVSEIIEKSSGNVQRAKEMLDE
ncbi:aspartate ammonia-lyase [Desulfosporosinus sp. HMP52]|uniref:aspartate ammonia-lyase n=1 Tax=Desulfosporosinus sp. HMP52 TaxID=1487923 RepID=UPI00051FA88E|nr:aspartate ammonia-lyase [Desulfosporosinus sp. HMP52]KGK88383.1 aspartate ammonia-lyase [Desulfosporosinus sp. HMP52]